MPGNNRKEVNGGGTKVEELDFRNNFMGNDSATDLASLLGANRCHLFVTSAALHLWEGTNQFPNPGCWCYPAALLLAAARRKGAVGL